MAAVFRTLISSQEPVPMNKKHMSLGPAKRFLGKKRDRVRSYASTTKSFLQQHTTHLHNLTIPPQRPYGKALYILHEHDGSSPETSIPIRIFLSREKAFAAAREIWEVKYKFAFGEAHDLCRMREVDQEGRLRGKRVGGVFWLVDDPSEGVEEAMIRIWLERRGVEDGGWLLGGGVGGE